MIQPTVESSLKACLQRGLGSIDVQPQWLMAERRLAADSVLAQGLPTRQDEAWRYANLSFMHQATYQVLPAPSEQAKQRWLQLWKASGHGRADVYRMVFLDGHYCPDLSNISSLPAGVSCDDLQVICRKEGVGESVLGCNRQARSSDETFVAMNTALWQSGMLLRVASGVKLAQPIQLVIGVTQPNVLAATRHVVEVAEGSEVQIEEIVLSAVDSPTLQLPVSFLSLAKAAHCRWVKCQQEGDQGVHLANLFAKQASGSQLYLDRFSLGGQFSRDDCRLDINGCDVYCCASGLHVGEHQQFMDTHLDVHHHAVRGNSRQNYRSVMGQASTSVFNGKVTVHPHAQQIDADQTSHNMLLGERARAFSKPELEIYADDVKCSHGTTVGQLDEDALFYLRARGVSLKQARQLLINAFVESVLNDVSGTHVYDVLKRVVTRRIFGLLA